MIYIILIILVSLFSLNMGGGNFGASFAAAYGGNIITKRRAQLLFGIFLFLGAVTIGRPVSETLGNRIIPSELIRPDTLVIIFISATLCLLIANIIHVPQSTSLVTVGSILGVGLYYKSIYTSTFQYLVPFWIGLPLLGYGLTYFLGRLVYPPRNKNFWIYEKLVNHRDRLKLFVIIASCYNAFSVGANNVANAVGPLAGAGIVSNILGLVLVAPVFGLGSLVFAGPLKTVSEKIVPIGLFSATIVCFVTGTIMIIASALGVPQSFVMIKVAALFAISGLKNGHRLTFSNPATKKTYLTWLITPIIAVILSYLLTGVKHVFLK
ncbi:MAG: inorganic phosphate transporter [Candidatus Omnitrophica bacterium]|nr:inorganic phosphate transporter [Candidatus Omnitrophota bacterium]